MNIHTGQTNRIKDRSLLWRLPSYLQIYKPPQLFRTTPVAASLRGKYKLIDFFETQSLELYHLQNDLGETRNLVSSHPEIRD